MGVVLGCLPGRRVFLSRWLAGRVLVLALLAACATGPVEVPPPLAGTWITQEPGFEGRSIELHGDAVVFGAGEGQFESNRITSLEQAETDEGTRYLLSYENLEGQEWKITLLLDGDRQLRLASRPTVVWEKRP